MARILLGVTGGIAAYRSLEFVRLATTAGHAVRVIQTRASHRFVGPASFAALSGAPVLHDEFAADPWRGAFPDQVPPAHAPVVHLEVVRNADLYLIAPASANTVARLAHGFADNLLCTAALAARCPVVVAPAMNDAMFEHPATQANLALLRQRGVVVIDPDTGPLASRGEYGVGRLAAPARLLEECELVLGAGRPPAKAARVDAAPANAASVNATPANAAPVNAAPANAAPVNAAPANAASVNAAPANAAPANAAPLNPMPPAPPAGRPWEGLHVLVTAGGTREAIDSVRFIGNRSSGRMGFALADAAAARGAQVTVVAANVALPRSDEITYIDVVSAGQLQAACEDAFAHCDILVMAAAVSDFRPASKLSGKVQRERSGRLLLDLRATPDVLASLAGARRDGQTIVGFAAEHGAHALERARAKLTAKHVDAVVMNDVSQPGIGFEGIDNEVTIVTAAGEEHVPRTSKVVVAEAVLDAVARLRAAAVPLAIQP